MFPPALADVGIRDRIPALLRFNLYGGKQQVTFPVEINGVVMRAVVLQHRFQLGPDGVVATRIIGSSFATTAAEVIALKMLHALEVPFLLVGAFKYITGVFDTRLSATIYLIGFQFAKQSVAIFLSAFAGNMYDRIGFQETYLMLGCFVLAITVVSAFTLSSRQEIAAAGAAALTHQSR